MDKPHIPLKILICDDDAHVTDTLKLALSELGEILTAENGTKCLDILGKAKDVKLVVLDVNMPGPNGMDILARIKNKYPHMPVIMMTGDQDAYYKDASQCLQASDLIYKPFRIQKIQEKCKALLKI